MTARNAARPPTDDPAILLVHGQPGTGGDWGALVEALGGGAHVLAIDRPGWDSGPPAPGGFADSAEAARRAMEAAGVERAVVVGHSYGAGVAAWLAVERPERVAALVLVAPSANTAALVGFDRWLALPVVGYLTSGALLFGGGVALGSARLRRRLLAELKVPDEYLRSAGRWLRSRPVRRAFFVEQRALLVDLPALERRLSAISVPTTVVIGTADHVVPPAAARTLAAQIPGAELVEVPGARHLLPASHPERLAELVLAAVTQSRTPTESVAG